DELLPPAIANEKKGVVGAIQRLLEETCERAFGKKHTPSSDRRPNYW
ncbi:hypothetical protein KM043_018873, partial [Ampulex compressa]